MARAIALDCFVPTFFVDYLRLAFRFGAFPGYDGAAEVPEEISALKAGLLEF